MCEIMEAVGSVVNEPSDENSTIDLDVTAFVLS